MKLQLTPLQSVFVLDFYTLGGKICTRYSEQHTHTHTKHIYIFFKLFNQPKILLPPLQPLGAMDPLLKTSALN